MQKRIFNVLLVASYYDAFILEEDGRVEEQIFFEYTSLNLSSPPRVTQVNNLEDAFKELSTKRFDLIIAIPDAEHSQTYEKAKEIKHHYPDIPIVLLTPFAREVSRRLEKEDLSGIDYVFSWLGNTDLLLAIIKLLEDEMNIEEDTKSGVQIIMLVEDSVRFYSSILPHLYKFVLKQSQIFSTEALNEHEQMLRMRGRPKIKLARSYEEAMEMYKKYANNILGIISDVSFMHEGLKDAKAGLKFCSYVREKDPFVPIIIESSDTENSAGAAALDACFLDKNSKKLPVDLRKAIMRNFGFGDFEFINPQNGEVIMRIKELKDLQKNILSIPAESLLYHASRNHISRWLYSRALFPLAEFIRRRWPHNLDELPEIRQEIFDSIVLYRKMKNRGVVAIFERNRFDKYSNFARIGQGSLGGKGRGLAFIDSLIKRHPILEDYEGISVSVPKTVVLCTDLFDEFMESNNLYQIALSDMPDEEILNHFLEASLPERLKEDILAFFEVVGRPIAVRSSSLLEDSHYQPFAGVYSTYMIPFLEDREEMYRMLSAAVKGVYASVFYSDSKAYMTATSNVIDQEKMAIILQEVVGTQYGDRYYPSFAGVGRSLNYYPINDEKAEDGVVDIAVGLGKYIVDGGRSLRFSPEHPNKVLQTSTLDLALRDTQTRFYALDLKNIQEHCEVDDSFNLLRLSIRDAEADNSLRGMISTFDPYDQVIRDGYYEGGRKVVTFANILQHNIFPLSPLLEMMLEYGSHDMGRHVEIEFAGILPNEQHPHGALYWLQIRHHRGYKRDAKRRNRRSRGKRPVAKNIFGSGARHHVGSAPCHLRQKRRILVVEQFAHRPGNRKDKQNISRTRRKLHTHRPRTLGIERHGTGYSRQMAAYIGRPSIIVETALSSYFIEPSQGTHFFQNLTSFGVGYFTLNPQIKDCLYDEDFLNHQEAVQETQFLRVVRFEQPLTVKINGRKSEGIVIKPSETQP